MDPIRFDRLARSLHTARPRRSLIIVAGGLLGSLLSRAPVAAACRTRGNTCGGRKKCCKRLTCCDGRCRSTNADPNHCGRTCKDCPAKQTCVNGTCTPHCKDGTKNFGETGIDCGGTCTGTCPVGQGCKEDRDCTTGRCRSTASGKACVECVINRDCEALNGTPNSCINNECFECSRDADCPKPGQAPQRDKCVEPVNGNCPAGKPCVCGECVRNEDCAPGQFCDEAGDCEGFTCSAETDYCRTGATGCNGDARCACHMKASGEPFCALAFSAGCARCHNFSACSESDSCIDFSTGPQCSNACTFDGQLGCMPPCPTGA